MNDKDVLKRALKDKHPGEAFEKSVGRTIRKLKGKYEDYVRIMGKVRDLAYSKKISVVEAAQEIVRQP